MVDLVTYTEEILNGKFYFFCSGVPFISPKVKTKTPAKTRV